MKRVDLIREIEALGCVLERHGGKHDWYRNPQTGVAQPVPRHREIPERLARHILKMLSNPQGDPSGS
jgi:predicted RNA binding protein YcfA (HicA-like mRNA interferase family)